MNLITDTVELSATCTRLAAHPFVTVDTEFMRETTYYARLCLIQIASPEEAVLIDPLAEGIDLSPFFALMADETTVKVFHSARQDVEIIWTMGNVIPTPLFDTQVAAMVCGYGDSVSYEQLANDLAKARIDKSSRFTDWSRLPLSEAQRAYALSDVTHLIPVYRALASQLAETGRSAWLDEEMAVLTDPATYEGDPARAHRRLIGRVRKVKELAVLIEVAAWREREAQSRDVPRSRVLKDDAVVELAISQPRDAEALARLRSVPKGFERSRSAAGALAAIEAGLARDLSELKLPERSRGRGNAGATVDLLKVLLKAVCEDNDVAPKIVATVDDLEAIAENDDSDIAALKGWRRRLFGERALALKHGRLSLAIEDGTVIVTPRAQTGSA